MFKVTGETNTDDLSPAPDAWSRPDIPLHALAMLKNARPGITPEEEGKRGPVKFIEELRARGNLVAYVGDVVGTGSSRKSATNSVLWFTGEDIPFVPNKRFGGVCLGCKIAPIFYNTMEDSGALPIELDVSKMDMGDEVELRPYEGKALKGGQVVAEFKLKSDVLFDEVRAGGRIPLIIGRGLTAKAREALGLPPSTLFRLPQPPVDTKKGFTLAQKMVGRACGLPEGQGVRPGTYCEPKMTSVGSQDTTGPDDARRAERPGLPGLLLRPGDAELLPHGGLSEARGREDAPRIAGVHQHAWRHQPAPGRRHHPLVAQPYAAARHRRHRRRQPHALSRSASASPPAPGWWHSAQPRASCRWTCPRAYWFVSRERCSPASPCATSSTRFRLYAIKAGLLTVAKQGKKNIFSGRVLEIEGLPDLKVEQAFELSDASAERSAGGCTVHLNKEPIIEYINSNITMLKWMIASRLPDVRTIKRRIAGQEAWLRTRNCSRPTPTPSTPP